MTRGDLETLCEIAVRAAREAGQMIREQAGCDLNVQHKNAGSHLASQVVTEVDFKSQDIILDVIRPTLAEYDLGLLIEESEDDGSRFDKDFFWCIDPMDGTLSFVKQRPGYCVSVAVVSHSGRAELGVVYDPVADVLYEAVSGAGAKRNGADWSLKAGSDPAESFEMIDPGAGGAVMSACAALERAPACFVKRPKEAQGGGCLWDYAATACLFEEMGAYVADWRGAPLDLNSSESVFLNRCGVLFASDAAVAEKVRASDGEV